MLVNFSSLTSQKWARIHKIHTQTQRHTHKHAQKHTHITRILTFTSCTTSKGVHMCMQAELVFCVKCVFVGVCWCVCVPVFVIVYVSLQTSMSVCLCVCLLVCMRV